jgi:ribonuclease HII
MAQYRVSLFSVGTDPTLVAGIDEAGRGCLAGPVVAGAVILPARCRLPGLTDSKLLSPARREELAGLIKARAVAWAVGAARSWEVDRLNVLQATFLAMRRAVAHLGVRPELLLVDGNKIIPQVPPDIAQQAIVDGDLKVRCISAASILAKTFRDRMLVRLDLRCPGYGLAGHKGYGTAEHLEALRRLGPCRAHRMTFRGVLPCGPDRTMRVGGRDGGEGGSGQGPDGRCGWLPDL